MAKESSLKKFVLLGLGVGLFVGALVVGWNFGAANATTIDIDLLWLTVGEVSVWKLALAAFGLGASSVGLIASFLGLRGWEFRRRYRKTIRGLESELHQMRSLPLSGAPLPAAAAAEDRPSEPWRAAGGLG
jgi:hypothetical protein